MLAVLGLLLLCTMMAAGLYAESEQHLFTTKAMAAQQVAVQRAEQGFQIGLQAVRSGAIAPLTLVTYCSSTLAQDCPVNARIAVAPVDNGPALDLKQGGGLQYQFYVIRRLQPGTPQNRYVIQSIGYYGYSTSKNILTSVVEGDVDIGTLNGGLAGAGNNY